MIPGIEFIQYRENEKRNNGKTRTEWKRRERSQTHSRTNIYIYIYDVGIIQEEERIYPRRNIYRAPRNLS